MTSGPATGAAAGLRDHSGWAVLVVVDGPAEAPTLVDRRRLTLCPDDLPRQAFHAAADCGSPAEARALVDRVERAVAVACREALASLPAGVPVAVASGPPRLPAALDEILAAHPFLHAAEGDLYRRHLAEAAAERGSRVVRYGPKTVVADVAGALGTQPELLEARLRELGRGAGPPWQQDHRTAAAAALLALLSFRTEAPAGP